MRSQIFNLIKDQSTLSWEQIAANILVSGILGFLIFISYMISHRGTIYSKKFNVSLVVLTVLTSMVMTVIGNNVALSLGMVGALSIVRFRTAIKEPMDIAFLFWSIAVGIVLGAGLIPLAVFGSLFVGLILWVFVNRKTSDHPYIMIVNCSGKEAEKQALSVVQKNVKKQVLKSKTVSKNGIELTLEVRLKGDDCDFVNEVSEAEGVESAVLVSYNGDYMS